jgi:Domain of unknown function (DUF4345)
MSERALQITTGILAAVPVLTGALGMMGLDDPLYAGTQLPRDATLDSNLRFFGGVWCGLGLTAFWLIPGIARQTVLFRALWLMIFIGGLGRLTSLLLLGTPFLPFVGFTLLEIVGAPLFVWWQAKVAHRVDVRARGGAVAP